MANLLMPRIILFFSFIFFIYPVLSFAKDYSKYDKNLEISRSVTLAQLINMKKFDAAKYLIEKGVKIDTEVVSALICAIEAGNQDFINYIWSLNPKLDAEIREYYSTGEEAITSPLLKSIQFGNEDIFFKLIDKGFDPKKQKFTKEQDDMMVTALCGKSHKIIKYLLDKGYKLDDKVLDEAIDGYNVFRKEPSIDVDFLKFLQANGVKFNNPDINAHCLKYLIGNFIDKIKEYQADNNIIDSNKEYQNAIEVVKFFNNYKIDSSILQDITERLKHIDFDTKKLVDTLYK